jgi:GH15 family glucan-1,4-alpha-glucosidase
VFAAILGGREHGRWELHPTDQEATATRRYDRDTFTLITRWESGHGVAEVHDLMPMDHRRLDVVRRADLLRRIVGISGEVEFTQRLTMRFDYARSLPWVRQVGTDDAPALLATAGPDAVILRGAALDASDHVHTGTVLVHAGRHVDLSLTWFPSHHEPPSPLSGDTAIERTQRWWQKWAERIQVQGPHAEPVRRSLLVLRALSHYDTGGIVAALTTSLPEQLGGSRNWDYRYVWLRDAALALQVLIDHDYVDAAQHWRGWLLRAIAGDPEQLRIMYGTAGERDLFERELPHLPGHAGSAPVRIGNAASDQYQGDVIGEVMIALDAARRAGLRESPFSWALQRALLHRLVQDHDRPDHGIWEVRGEPRMFTHSRVMMWAALDCGVRAVRAFGLDGPDTLWETIRDRLRAEIDTEGVSADGHFTQYYGTEEVDAALLLLPAAGYCAPDDPRMSKTVKRIEDTLMRRGFLYRYRTNGIDGIDETENAFLACSFWLVEQYAATGRVREADALMDRLCHTHNDVSLFAEEYDVDRGQLTGNIPQAFSHLTLVRAATALERAQRQPNG